jgi:signal transduction histidine kinase
LVDDGLPALLARRLTTRQWAALDGLLAIVLAATSVAVSGDDLHAAGRPHGLAYTTVVYVAIGAATLPLPGRRRYPRTVLATCVAAEAVLVSLGIRLPAELAAGFAMYTLAATAGPAVRYRVVAASLGPLLAATFLAWDGHAVTTAILAGVLACGSVLVGWLAGENSRARRLYALDLAERAAERERERARRAAVEERARIARELHDVVAHAMSVIAVRSGVARRIGEAQPGQAIGALSIIETISRRSLGELGQIVAVLRQDAQEPGGEERAPAPGLGDLAVLAGQIGAAGVRVDLCVEGTAQVLPPTQDLTAYRIAQEALTNVVRHSGADTATLWVRYRPGAVEIECTDPGGRRRHHPAAAGLGNGGHGIIGMRERVAVYGGQFSAGPAGPGFRVLARLPVGHGP